MLILCTEQIQGLEGDVDRTKQRLDEKASKLHATSVALNEAESSLDTKRAELDSLTAAHRVSQQHWIASLTLCVLY